MPLVLLVRQQHVLKSVVIGSRVFASMNNAAVQ